MTEILAVAIPEPREKNNRTVPETCISNRTQGTPRSFCNHTMTYVKTELPGKATWSHMKTQFLLKEEDR